jgi:proline racemase
MATRTAAFARQQDHVRRALVHPPRGHQDLTAAVLTEPVSPGAHAGLICMDGDGYALHGQAVIAAATIALERRLVFDGETGPEVTLLFDTVAGTVQARARIETRAESLRVDAVTLVNVPAFVHTAAQPVRVGTRELRVDIAFGGAFHAIVDTEAVGIALDGSRLPELRRLAIDLLESLNDSVRVVHPASRDLKAVAALTITSAPRDPEAHLRSVSISAGGGVDPSPGVTGTCAVMAVLDAMGLLPDDLPFVHEGLSGALLRGRPVRRTQVGELQALVAEVTGTAWITGDHTFVLDDDDPFRDGYAL